MNDNFKEPTNRSHPISCNSSFTWMTIYMNDVTCQSNMSHDRSNDIYMNDGKWVMNESCVIYMRCVKWQLHAWRHMTLSSDTTCKHVSFDTSSHGVSWDTCLMRLWVMRQWVMGQWVMGQWHLMSWDPHDVRRVFVSLVNPVSYHVIHVNVSWLILVLWHHISRLLEILGHFYKRAL